jgi:hypothetical protein
MRMVVLSLILVATASAQHFDQTDCQVNETEATAVFGPPHAAPILTSAPYSADEVQEHSQTYGASGPTRVVIGHFGRDTQGRTRTQESYKWAPIRLAEILDPIKGVAYLLDDQKKIAHRMLLAPALATQAPATEDPRTTIESLGTQTIEGVVTQGIRKIFRSSHNLTIETWESPEFKITLLTRSSNGYSTMLTNLSRDPDPALFLPPPAYTVVDETKPFPMTIQLQ